MAAAMLPLAGCGSKEDASSEPAAVAPGEEKSIDDVKREAGKLIRPEPGAYKQTVEIVDMQVPGLPDSASAQMKNMMKKVETHTLCITEEDAEQSYKDMFENVGQDGDCSYTKFDVSGGRLDAQMQCSTPESGQATMTMNGTVGETNSDIMIGMDVTGSQGPMGNMKMKMHMISERTGECAS
ncbi:hypothetical protein LK12_04080 [Novosphingobium malaysiense]|uniref:DUF3617 domain-containing protein n=1 Tax=Novosphingobium malaysiense TaxID=1348853 RepID=A0A0B1ZX18_9SPHN|nr:hypothetical protein LK12_04080 [Novosphingobium malaysiense]